MLGNLPQDETVLDSLAAAQPHGGQQDSPRSFFSRLSSNVVGQFRETGRIVFGLGERAKQVRIAMGDDVHYTEAAGQQAVSVSGQSAMVQAKPHPPPRSTPKKEARQWIRDREYQPEGRMLEYGSPPLPLFAHQPVRNCPSVVAMRNETKRVATGGEYKAAMMKNPYQDDVYQEIGRQALQDSYKASQPVPGAGVRNFLQGGSDGDVARGSTQAMSQHSQQTGSVSGLSASKSPPLLSPIGRKWGKVWDRYDTAADDALPLTSVSQGEVMSHGMNGMQTHKAACYLLQQLAAGNMPQDTRVYLLAYGFDVKEVTECLVRAAQAGYSVTAIVDFKSALGDRVRDQTQRMQQLRAGGVAVRLCRGFDIAPVYQAAGRYAPYGDGIQHGKVLLVGHYLLAGSANWTVASRCNVEYGLLVALSSEGVEQFRKTFQKSYDRSVDFTLEVQAGAGHRCVKPRARSMSPYHSPSPHGTKYLRQGYAQFGG